MDKKQILIKGFEIGLNSKDSVHTQMQLAELMANLKDNEQGLCYNCKYGNIGGCQLTIDGEMVKAQYEMVGMTSIVNNCDRYDKK